MKAIVQPAYGSPAILRLADVARPEPAEDQILVRVRASSVNAADWHLLRGRPHFARLMMGGLRKPANAVPGVDVAGVVEAVGSAVTEFRPGDLVMGARNGAFAEYVAGKNFVHKPPNISFEQAATVAVAGCTALQAVRDHGSVGAGQRVLVNGAGGGVGSFTVQIAKAFGAEVTATTRTDTVELIRSLGADQVIDYTQHDFTRTGRQWDVVIDIAGTPSLGACRRALTPTGTLVMVGAGKGRLGVFGRPVAALLRRRLLGQRIVTYLARVRKDDLAALKELIEAGRVAPVIDRVYTLSEAAAAMRHLGEGRARGKVVIAVAQEEGP